MPLTEPRDSVIGVVGDGFGSLHVHATARYLGFRPGQVTIFGANDNPLATYQQFAYDLGQTVLRSESESHFLPADWPTFAELEAWSRRSIEPLVRSTRRRYNPPVSEMLVAATVVRRLLGWDDDRMPVRIGWVRREMSPFPHFVLFDEDANYVGRVKHLVLAIGHGPLAFPPALARAKAEPLLADRIAQAYQAKAYAPGGRYVVVGAGIAAVNEWVNALDVGASVVSLLRSPEPDEQDLNAPRCMFEAYGIDAFAGLPLDERLDFLGKILKGTSPSRRTWNEKVEAGRAAGRFEQLMGEIDRIEPGVEGLRLHLVKRDGTDLGWLDATGVVAATGFEKSSLTVPLYRRLVEHYGIPVERGRITLLSNCGIPGLDRPESRLCVMGIMANEVVPHGDTIAGLKYIARRFVADCAQAEQLRQRSLLARVRLQLRLAAAASRAMAELPRTEQLA